MSESTASLSFNNSGCLRPGEYIADEPCEVCGSLTRVAKTNHCASCEKVEAARQRAKTEFNARRRLLDLEREIRQIERQSGYDLMEY